MRTNSGRFAIDTTPRHGDGQYVAHARISVRLPDGSPRDVHLSGDLGGFDLRSDAIAYARKWASEWLDGAFAAAEN
ncbi:hypothetical protein AB4Y44_30675 [Paraburkholderia sp. BR10937]|uniref:hypothetical protein n=1 Tax=Paraburkholderia sp. BR10937 TaxID=3236994 RepID=UPI0034D163AC